MHTDTRPGLVTSRTPCNIYLSPYLSGQRICCPGTVELLIKAVTEVTDKDLQVSIDTSPKTLLLRYRREMLEDELTLVTRRRRHYLTLVRIPDTEGP